MVIERWAVEPFLKNGYVLACSKMRQAAYIDPGDESAQALDWIEGSGYELASVLLTHAHIDHICGIGSVIQRRKAPIYLHPDDEPLYNALEAQSQWFGLSCPPAPPVDRHLSEKEEVKVGELRLKVHHTPGHSPGGVCLEVGNHVFCGDAIFAGSIGRTDLPGASQAVLMRSIRDKILTLGDEKILHPGHGPDSTIGHERRTNPFIIGSPYLSGE